LAWPVSFLATPQPFEAAVATVFFRSTIVFLLAISLAIPAHAQCPPGSVCPTGGCPTWPQQWTAPQTPQWAAPKTQAVSASIPQLVRVGNSRPDGIYYASGVIVGDDGQASEVLTSWHTFRMGVGPITVDGAAAEMVDTDKENDLVLLRIPTRRIKPLRVCAGDPGPGIALRAFGFGAGRAARIACRVIGYAITKATGLRHTLVVRGGIRDGDSGGPILNTEGELVGILWGTDDRDSYATNAGCIRSFLQRHSEACDQAGPAPSILPGPGDDEPPPLPAPPVPQPPQPDPCEHIVMDLKLVQVQAEENTKRIEVLENNHLMLSETLRNLVEEVAKLTEHEHAPDDGPLFYVVHRDPKTGEIIPQYDPATGKTYTIQPINRGDDWTIYLHDSARKQGASK
jgi:hypothetical protein